MTRPIIYHIPVCPFSQRIEILLELKGLRDAVEFRVIDITVPRPDWLLEKTRGTTALPVLETPAGGILKESIVILEYIEALFPSPPIARTDPYERAVERLMITREGPFGVAGYRMVMNRDRARTDGLRDALLSEYRWLNDFLEDRNPGGLFLFDSYGMAELVYTSLMMRFWFLDYYEGFTLPETPDYARVRRWRDACLEHPAAQQVGFEQIVKLYYDYAVGSGNGALPEGRQVSSFAFEPDWRNRPMPPRDKYDRIASDTELGLA
ncbi:glutathione S-transferase family protein [Halovulum dunhuangense]|uniref:Glutathione S-transferase family protein n=1 Tax=Halovulum dunhuangense TaxID=1505036 RepID=A0A849L0V0_9RHOB|nr:glutathione S-transferase family protein [Halovulum dunhuangense]